MPCGAPGRETGHPLCCPYPRRHPSQIYPFTAKIQPPPRSLLRLIPEESISCPASSLWNLQGSYAPNYVLIYISLSLRFSVLLFLLCFVYSTRLGILQEQKAPSFLISLSPEFCSIQSGLPHMGSLCPPSPGLGHTEHSGEIPGLQGPSATIKKGRGRTELVPWIVYFCTLKTSCLGP